LSTIILDNEIKDSLVTSLNEYPNEFQACWYKELVGRIGLLAIQESIQLDWIGFDLKSSPIRPNSSLYSWYGNPSPFNPNILERAAQIPSNFLSL